jgi:hypothetical protein
MPHYAIINGSTVINVIIADTLEDANQLAPHIMGQFAIEIPNEPNAPGLGWSYDGSVFTKINPEE